MSSSDVRWLLFGVVGLAAMAAWYANQSAVDGSAGNDVVVSSDADQPDAAPLEIAVTEIEEPVAEKPVEPEPPVEVPVPAPEVAPPTTPVTPAPVTPTTPVDVYSGTHKLGVNRVTDMARVGSATFTRKNGALYLEGRVKRGVYWLQLRGTVEPRGNDKFVLNGVIEGIPNLSWRGAGATQQRTEGSFLFEVNKRRPYWRLYQVNGRECVCDDNCGNDFCYIDIETKPQG